MIITNKQIDNEITDFIFTKSGLILYNPYEPQHAPADLTFDLHHVNALLIPACEESFYFGALFIIDYFVNENVLDDQKMMFQSDDWHTSVIDVLLYFFMQAAMPVGSYDFLKITGDSNLRNNLLWILLEGPEKDTGYFGGHPQTAITRYRNERATLQKRQNATLCIHEKLLALWYNCHKTYYYFMLKLRKKLHLALAFFNNLLYYNT